MSTLNSRPSFGPDLKLEKTRTNQQNTNQATIQDQIEKPDTSSALLSTTENSVIGAKSRALQNTTNKADVADAFTPSNRMFTGSLFQEIVLIKDVVEEIIDPIALDPPREIVIVLDDFADDSKKLEFRHDIETLNDPRARSLMDYLEWHQDNGQAIPDNGRFGTNGVNLLSHLPPDSEIWDRFGPISQAERQLIVDSAKRVLDPENEQFLAEVHGGDQIFEKNDLETWLISTIDEMKHGDHVSSILKRRAPSLNHEDVKHEQGGDEETEDSFHGDETLIDDLIVDGATSVLDGYIGDFNKILKNPGNARVVNVSSGGAPIELIEDLFEQSKKDPDKRAKFLEQLSLPSDASDKDLYQGLVNRAQQTLKNNEIYRQVKSKYDTTTQEMYKRGIFVVVAAGNTGLAVDRLKADGIQFDQPFLDSINVNSTTLLAVSLDDVNNTPGDASDDVPAEFSTPESESDYATDGQDVDGKGSGNSFSAPQVAATIAEILKINPSLTNDDVRTILNFSVTDTNASQQEEGAGVLNRKRAVRIATYKRDNPQASWDEILTWINTLDNIEKFLG